MYFVGPCDLLAASNHRLFPVRLARWARITCCSPCRYSSLPLGPCRTKNLHITRHGCRFRNSPGTRMITATSRLLGLGLGWVGWVGGGLGVRLVFESWKAGLCRGWVKVGLGILDYSIFSFSPHNRVASQPLQAATGKSKFNEFSCKDFTCNIQPGSSSAWPHCTTRAI